MSDSTPKAEEIESRFKEVQDHICNFLVEQDGVSYREDLWSYDKGDGGGRTRVWENGNLIEKGGVNFSGIRGGSLPPSAATKFRLPEGTKFLATGVSLVIHPHNPHIPTIHMNIRYFEAGEVSWFGGGIDVTPYYPVREQVVNYHRRLKQVCDESGEDYVSHKQQCDDYFYLPHREEARGVSGTFFDHLQEDKRRHFEYCVATGMAFPELYGPFIESNREKPVTSEQRDFQLYRRGRYVEFNLVYDRGTTFGLQSKGRTESILMSLPAVAHWRYDWKPEAGTPEAALQDYLQPQDWLA